MFVPRFAIPENGNPYYNLPEYGGYAVGIIPGSPLVPGLTVLSNCVGYAAARFNEIIGQGMFIYFQYAPAPHSWLQAAREYGLKTGTAPKPGAVIVWGHHVAIVEQINTDGTIITSESGYNSKNPFWTETRNNQDGCWNGSAYNGFQGFIYQPEEEKTMNGIDVSAHNGKIDWKTVRADGVQFAILRAGLGKFSSQKDERFDENYTNAKAAGLPVGAYWYSYATTVEEAKQEAAACLEVLKGKQYEFPIWFDQEEKVSFDTGKENCSAMVRAFCDTLEKAGYWAGLYTSRACLQSYIDDSIKKRYSLWVAEWGSKLNYSGAVGIWQKSCTGCISGISGDVDLDIAYQDYPSQIKAKGLNGFSKPDTSPPSSDSPDTVTVKLEINGTVYGGTLSAMA